MNSSLVDQNLTDAELEEMKILEAVNFYINDILGAIIFSFGILFNLTSLIYFQLSRSFRDTSMRHYFSVLSITDSLRLSEWLFSYLFDKKLILLNENFCSALLFITITSGHISIWLLVFLSIERFFILQFPFKGKQIYTTKNSLRMLCLVIFVLILFDIPYLLPNFVTSTWINYEFHLYLCGTNKIYRTYMFVNNVLFYSFIPFIILLVFNCLLISVLSRSNNELLNMGHTENSVLNNKRDRQFKERTILLISVTFFLILTVSPRYIYQNIIIVTKNTGLLKIPIAKCLFILEMLNFGTNFLFYTICSKTSRNELFLIIYYYFYWRWSKNYKKYPICNHPNHNKHLNTSDRLNTINRFNNNINNNSNNINNNSANDSENNRNVVGMNNSNKNSKFKIHCFLLNATRLRTLQKYESIASKEEKKNMKSTKSETINLSVKNVQ